MDGRMHRYAVNLVWEGDRGEGAAAYRSDTRNHVLTAGAKPAIPGSSDPSFSGDPARWNPEELLVASLAACHQLWYLHLASEAGIVVTAYADAAEGEMAETPDGGGRFTRVTLRPRVTISAGDPACAAALHEEAHQLCFIANSVNFPVECEAETVGAWVSSPARETSASFLRPLRFPDPLHRPLLQPVDVGRRAADQV